MPTQTKRRRILIVEDYRLAREMYRVTLEHAGFDVLEAADGVEALLRVRDGAPDLILMDLWMPLMDGWEATHHLKSDSRTASIPIVVLSASAHDYTAQEITRAGCAAFVSKPCLPSELVQEVEPSLGVT